MQVRLVLAAVAIVALAGGCGGDSRRDAVVAYIDDANAIQRQLLIPLGAARRAYADFSKSGADFEEMRPRLTKARQTIETLERKLARLEAPPEAERLHDLLLELVESQAELAHEVELLATFLPEYERGLAPLRAAERRLRTALTGARDADAQAAAINRYGSDVEAVLKTLDGLLPPAPLAVEYETQVATLTKVEGSAAALARALRNGDTDVLPARLRQFAEAARGNRTLAAQRANIAALKAYNSRVSRLGRLAEQVNLERVRLQSTLD